jgi:hypothetical protein
MILSIILTGLFYLTPGNAELCYRHTSSSGNMGLTGVYLDIINKRNLVYFSGFILLVILFAPFEYVKLVSYCLFLFSVLAYFHSVKTWHVYLY